MRGPAMLLCALPLLGCGDLLLPRCADGEALTAGEGGALRCRSAAAPPLPPCAEDEVLFATADGLTCGRASADADSEAELAAQLAKSLRALGPVTAQLAQMERRVPGQARFLGVTAVKSRGHLQMALPEFVDSGLVAGAKLCGAEYPRAHLCTVYELLASIEAGRLDDVARVPRAWVYAPAWSRPVLNPEQPEAGLADTCASYTYPLGARHWTGVAMEWSDLPTGVVGLRLHGGAEAACYETLPLACCR